MVQIPSTPPTHAQGGNKDCCTICTTRTIDADRDRRGGYWGMSAPLVEPEVFIQAVTLDVITPANVLEFLAPPAPPAPAPPARRLAGHVPPLGSATHDRAGVCLGGQGADPSPGDHQHVDGRTATATTETPQT